MTSQIIGSVLLSNTLNNSRRIRFLWWTETTSAFAKEVVGLIPVPGSVAFVWQTSRIEYLGRRIKIFVCFS